MATKPRFEDAQIEIQASIHGVYERVTLKGKKLGNTGLGYYGGRHPMDKELVQTDDMTYCWPTCLANGLLIGKHFSKRECETFLRDLSTIGFNWADPPKVVHAALPFDVKIGLIKVGLKHGVTLYHLYPDQLDFEEVLAELNRLREEAESGVAV